MKWNNSKKYAKRILALLCAGMMLTGMSVVVFADTQATVNVDSVNVRSKAGTDGGSTVVGKAAKGAVLTITEETTDASGTSWYKVTSGNLTGYVRSDLVTKSETEPVTDTTQEVTEQAGTTVELPSGVSSMDAQYASVSVEICKVRSDASTATDIVDNLEKDTQITVLGQKNGSSDGKTWYYVAFEKNGGPQTNGYIRSDLVTLGDLVPVVEEVEAPAEEVPEVSVEEEPVIQDYEVVYTDDGNGQNVWYLYNHLDNTRQKVDELLNYTVEAPKLLAAADKAAATMKIAVIALAVLLIVAVIAIIVLSVKLRDAFYEEYYEDEEDEDDDEDEDDEDDEEDEEEEEEYVAPKKRSPLRRKEAAYQEEISEREVRRPESRKEIEASEERPVSRKNREIEEPEVRPAAKAKKRVVKEEPVEEPVRTEERVVKRPAPKKAKNFLLDDLDDDFEFEFLNMDDRKK